MEDSHKLCTLPAFIPSHGYTLNNARLSASANGTISFYVIVCYFFEIFFLSKAFSGGLFRSDSSTHVQSAKMAFVIPTEDYIQSIFA